MASCLCACARNMSDHENRTQGGPAALHEVLLTRPDIHGEVSTGSEWLFIHEALRTS